MSLVRTRMAPSPTGEYHIGHIRTVLYNYALSRKNKGKFIIRIEDTDQERLIEGATDRILDVINSYNLEWDEGPRIGGDFGPYIQSQRLDLYKKYVDELVESGHAYRCFCTKEELDQMRKDQQERGLAKTMYDGRCRDLTPEQINKSLGENLPYVVRQKIPRNEKVTFVDEVYGEITFDTNEVDDTVLLKSDGFPTYHLAVVVDDHLMEISHILRGNDWLPSTPKHVLLYKAFGWNMPKFVHLPNLKEKGENKKLSKRFGSVYATDFLQEGYLVEALLNFLMLLGWNPGTEKEIFSLSEFIESFDISRIHKTDLVAFDREKLLWTNGFYIRNTSLEKLQKIVEKWASDFNVDLGFSNFSQEYKLDVLAQIQDRMRCLGEYTSLTHFYFSDPFVDSELVLKFAKTEQDRKKYIKEFASLYENIENDDWTSDNLEKISYNYIKEKGYKPKEAFMTLRIQLTGEKATPPIFDIMALLGKEVVLRRLQK